MKLTEEKKARLRYIAGWVVLVFTLFTLVAVVSYLFTWQADQSVVRDAHMMDAETSVQNSGGKLGLRWGHFLVAECFGFASLLLPVFLSALSLRLLLRRNIPLRKPLLATLTGTFIASFLLAYLAPFLGLQELFGSGPGGACGTTVTDWSVQLVGLIVTGIILLALLCLWLFFVSPRFNAWMLSLGEKPARPTDVPETPAVAETLEPQPEYAPLIAEEDIDIDIPDIQETPENEVETPVQPVLQPEPPAEGGISEIVTDNTLDQAVYRELPRIDNRLDPDHGGLPKFEFPPLDLLGDYASARHEVPKDELERNNTKIRVTLGNYKIQVVDVKAIVGPTVTLYKVYPAPGVKISTIKNLQEDIAMSLNARGVRVVNLPDSVGIEVANDAPSMVPLKALLNDPAFRESKAELPVAIGYTITQKVKVFDLADAPHLLVAGATKQGKSVGLNVIVSSLLYAKHPSELKFVFIDPKMVEFSAYGKLLNHYLAVLPNAASERDDKEQAIVKNA